MWWGGGWCPGLTNQYTKWQNYTYTCTWIQEELKILILRKQNLKETKKTFILLALTRTRGEKKSTLQQAKALLMCLVYCKLCPKVITIVSCPPFCSVLLHVVSKHLLQAWYVVSYALYVLVWMKTAFFMSFMRVITDTFIYFWRHVWGIGKKAPVTAVCCVCREISGSYHWHPRCSLCEIRSVVMRLHSNIGTF